MYAARLRGEAARRRARDARRVAAISVLLSLFPHRARATKAALQGKRARSFIWPGFVSHTARAARAAVRVNYLWPSGVGASRSQQSRCRPRSSPRPR